MTENSAENLTEMIAFVQSIKALRVDHVVVMGVSGCGKSTVAGLIAHQLGLALIEGDSFHPARNILKMQSGAPLTYEDRAGWLATLGAELAAQPKGAVMTCSALKKSYRDRLRQAVPSLYVVHIAITEEEAFRRVHQRPDHFYPVSLVASQFAALQDPSAEPGVLTLAGDASPDEMARQTVAWLESKHSGTAG